MLRADQESLDSALQSASQEGNLELVKALVESGADKENVSPENQATPFDRASYNVLFSFWKKKKILML